MSWRTVVIANRCKLDLSLGYMVVRGETTSRILIDEMAVLMIENPAVAMTGCLLSELTSRKVRIVFCDEKRNPYAEMQPYHGCHDSTRKIRQQMAWTDGHKMPVWTEIVKEKIRNQAQVLLDRGLETAAEKLTGYYREVQYGDATNREGHAAKVYFNTLFGLDFHARRTMPSMRRWTMVTR